MVINGMDMSRECDKRFDGYIKEIETKNNAKFDDEQLDIMKKIFEAGFSGCLDTILPKDD